MKELAIITSISKSFKNAGFQLKKHSPEILVVAGVIGVVASAVMACKATTKASGILADAKVEIDAVHDCVAEATEEYTQEDAQKDLALIYFQTGVKFVKLYSPAVILGVLSLCGIIASNNILRKRNVALAAAFSAADKGFKEYRNRVIERFGVEVDRELKHGVKAQTIERVVVDDKGKEKKVTETIQVIDQPSEYARFFDESCPDWEKNPEFNLIFLRAQQQYANDRLVANGHLFLNEVYDMLGFDRTKAGQVVGWVYDPDNPNSDSYVDFGIYSNYRRAILNNRGAVNGYEPVIMLDFNVDGNIWELM